MLYANALNKSTSACIIIPTVFFILQVLVCAALFKLSPQYPCSYDHVSNTRLRDLYRIYLPGGEMMGGALIFPTLIIIL